MVVVCLTVVVFTGGEVVDTVVDICGVGVM